MSVNNDHDSDRVRKDVSQAYAEAILKIAPSESSCCSPGCCTPEASLTAESIGYRKAELELLPEEVTSTSFGCGNPLAFTQVQPGQTVLDLGSGAGLDLLLAAQRVGAGGQVIGVDMTDAMIQRARENIARAGADNVEVRKGLIEALPVDSGSVDWVISNCVINLSPEKHRVFAEISRVLKPGGVMQVSDIVTDELPDWIRARADLFTACIAGATSEDEYLAGVREAGLEAAEVAERVTYDETQIRVFLASEELPASTEGREPPTAEELDRIAQALAGRVHSAKIIARKPR